MGLIATNTIGQGDTRETGLFWIVEHGGTIYQATRRLRWPGQAAVIISVVHVSKKSGYDGSRFLDGTQVEKITSYLFHTGGDDKPYYLFANKGQSFLGSKIYGAGFLFEDGNPGATPISEMEQLVARDHRNSAKIFPYIGGEDLNDRPTHTHRCFVINFGEADEAE